MSTLEIAVIIATAVSASLIKSISGMGYPLIVLPVLALFIDIDQAIYIVAFSNFALNAVLAWNTRGHLHKSATLPGFLLGAVIGGALGALLLPLLSERALRLALVGIVAVFLVTRWRSPSFTLPKKTAENLARHIGVLAGVMQGATGISGPIVTPWFMSVGLSRQAFVGSITTVFAISGLAQMVVLAALGEFDRDVLVPGLLLVPVALLMLPLGVRLRDRVSGRVFDTMVVTLLAASAITILIRL